MEYTNKNFYQDVSSLTNLMEDQDSYLSSRDTPTTTTTSPIPTASSTTTTTPPTGRMTSCREHARTRTESNNTTGTFITNTNNHLQSPSSLTIKRRLITNFMMFTMMVFMALWILQGGNGSAPSSSSPNSSTISTSSTGADTDTDTITHITIASSSWLTSLSNKIPSSLSSMTSHWNKISSFPSTSKYESLRGVSQIILEDSVVVDEPIDPEELEDTISRNIFRTKLNILDPKDSSPSHGILQMQKPSEQDYGNIDDDYDDELTTLKKTIMNHQSISRRTSTAGSLSFESPRKNSFNSKNQPRPSRSTTIPISHSHEQQQEQQQRRSLSLWSSFMSTYKKKE